MSSGGVEAIVMNASGCGVTVKEYGHLLRDDPAYAEKARRIGDLTRDLAEMLPQYEEELVALDAAARACIPSRSIRRARCSTASRCAAGRAAADGARLRSAPARRQPSVLRLGRHLLGAAAGARRTRCATASSSGSQALEPQMIVSANIGCIPHLQSGTATPVAHWIELVEHLLYG